MSRKRFSCVGMWSSLSMLALAFVPMAARADVGDVAWANQGDYQYRIVHMPDIDQRRQDIFDGTVVGLPNNGSLYCVPTSCTNLLAYMAAHGFPNGFPGVSNWQSNSLTIYNTMSNDLYLLGLLMNTDPFTKGTSGGGAVNALDLLLDPNLFVVDNIWAKNNYSPVFTDLALLAIQGRLVNVGVGWYDNPVGNVHVRNGGHLVTLASADGPGLIQPHPIQMGIRDPANDFSLFTQSPFATDVYNIQDELTLFGYLDVNTNSYVVNQRTQSKVVGYGNGYIDGAIVITPKVALATEGPYFAVLTPVAIFNAEANLSSKTFYSATGGNVMDFAHDPIHVKSPYLIEGDDHIYELNAVTGESSTLMPTDSTAPFLPAVQRPQRLVMGGPERRLYVLQPDRITCLTRDGRGLSAVAIPEPFAAIAYDAKSNVLVGYARRSARLYAYSADLRPLGNVRVTTPFCPAEGSSRLTLSFKPQNDDLWAHEDGSPTVFRVRFNLQDLRRGTAPREDWLMRSDLRGSVGLDVDAQGTLFTTVQGHLLAFDEKGRTSERTPFQGMACHGPVQIIRAFSNFDPATMEGPSYWNVLPPTTPGR